MLFILSKVVGGLLRPISLILIALALSFHWHRSKPVASRRLLGAIVLLLALFHLAPVSAWLAEPLEQRFPQPTLPARVDGIIVLGGVINPRPPKQVQVPQLNDAAERITAPLVLMRNHPEARLLFTGGSASLDANAVKEADIAKELFLSLGVDPQRMLFERNSRNTWENAVDSLPIGQPKDGETWVLVTSAWHMPRAVGCFRRAGWKVIPYPVDYAAPEVNYWFIFNGDEQLSVATFMIKEWIGLVSYHLLGRTDAFFPSPSVPPP
jgi:uncharacterized SAM-binding protein YcdF (DUF218 family)